jgi:hypothetical protein
MKSKCLFFGNHPLFDCKLISKTQKKAKCFLAGDTCTEYLQAQCLCTEQQSNQIVFGGILSLKFFIGVCTAYYRHSVTAIPIQYDFPVREESLHDLLVFRSDHRICVCCWKTAPCIVNLACAQHLAVCEAGWIFSWPCRISDISRHSQ